MFLAYNLPFLLWVAWAVVSQRIEVAVSICFFDLFDIRCPGCGLTTELKALLLGQSASHDYIYFIVAIFALNFISSLKYLKGQFKLF